MGKKLDLSEGIWISWQEHIRTSSLCESFGMPLFTLKTSTSSFVRHFWLSLKTFSLLVQKRPPILFVQNPSLVLTLFSVLVRPLFKFRLVVDAHNEGVQPYLNNSSMINKITNFVLERADITIVTNSNLANYVKAKKGYPIILPDKVPSAEHHESSPTIKLSDKFNLLFICTFAPDEPYVEIFNAASELQDDVTIYVTGNYNKISDELLKDTSVNVVFLGFVSEPDYWSYMKSVDAVIDLTKMDDCLVCGAYESVSVNQPLITSNFDALKEYFNEGTVYCDNTTNGIIDSISEIKNHHHAYQLGMMQLKINIENQWNEHFNLAKMAIESGGK